MDHPIQNQRPNRVLIKKKNIPGHVVDIPIPTDHRVTIKETESINKYLDLARERKKNRNMRVKVISIIVGALGTLHKDQEKN